MLGSTSVSDAAAASVALQAGVQTIVDLPLSAERLARALRGVPTVATPTAPISVGKLTIDAGRHRLDWAGTLIDVTPREFEVVLELARHTPGVATLDQLAQIYPGNAADPFAAVRVVITHVRSRLFQVRSEERHVGQASVSTCRSRGSPHH